ncbi:MAG TPA: heavy metal-associated domain-containing protein [Candidatus Aquilonibacter sp.]
MNDYEYTIPGMTCENCRRHVTAALSALPGVREVRVDLAGGRTVLRADRDLAQDEVRAALEEAGYELV